MDVLRGLPEVCRGKPGLPPGVYAGDVLMSNRLDTEENMSDEYVKIKKENVLQAAEQCDTARDVLKALFPDLFESKLKYKVGDKVMVEAEITDTDDSDMPYAVKFPDGIDGWLSREAVEGK
jgi:hypothetical protein